MHRIITQYLLQYIQDSSTASTTVCRMHIQTHTLVEHRSAFSVAVHMHVYSMPVLCLEGQESRGTAEVLEPNNVISVNVVRVVQVLYMCVHKVYACVSNCMISNRMHDEGAGACVHIELVNTIVTPVRACG